jgi:uncharacterized repeat protein (TIGR03803 family)
VVALVLAPGAWAAGKYKVLYKFTGGSDGSQPGAGLIFDASGNLYGTTTAGGASGNGTVFKLTKNADGSWTESLLYSFAGGTDGATPEAEVTFDTNGNLYGTTYYGGAFSAGAVFQLAPNSDGTWTETLLYSFTAGSDGANPYAGLIFDSNGNLYGTTYLGGVSGVGVVYKLAPNSDGTWTESVLHTFTGGDGSYPDVGNLTFDTDGNLYGVADYGGGSGVGVVYKLTPNSNGTWTESVLHTFTGGTDGRSPDGTLIFDSAGRLYGNAGGGSAGYGNVFKLILGAKGKWTEHVLYMFQGNQDGAYPVGGVVLDTTGNLYGTTNMGEDLNGACCFGQVFKLTAHTHGWTKHAPHRFQGPPRDGGNSGSPVVFDAAGNLYGTAYDAFGGGYGVVFEYIK